MPGGSLVTSTAVKPYIGSTARKFREITSRESELITAKMREFGQYQVRRANFAQQWEEVAELIHPTSRNTFFYQSFNYPGQKKTQQQVDATGALALHRFCAIADSLVTPRNQQWHGLRGDPYVMKDRACQIWFEEATDLLFQLRYASNGNFVGQNYNNWQSLGAFGNSIMYIDKFDGRWAGGMRGLRYKSVPLGECFFGENHQGKVDRMIRWFRRTAAQAVQQWGEDALPETLRPALTQDSQHPYNFLHCVRPRDLEDFDPDALDAKSMAFSSHTISIEGRCLMEPEGGYRTFPYAVSRYDQAPGEVEGRGPGQIVLPALKTLNAEKITFLTQGHRAASPVLLVADDGLVGMDMRPGSLNKGGVTADGKPLVHVLPTGNIQISEKMMGEERGIIDDVFLVSLFKVLSEHPNMTATQVIELVNEKAMLVAPTLGRQHVEYVGAMVPRELDLVIQMGLLPPMPPRLREAGGEYEVTDTSPLALAAQMGEAAGANRWVENLRVLSSELQDPSWLDVVSSDVMSKDLGRIYSVRTTWTATEDEIQQKRKARADQQAQAAAVQALPAQAAMIKAQAAVAKQSPAMPA